MLRSGNYPGAVVAIVLLAWTVASNHCALGVMLATHQAAASEHACCHEEPAPATPCTLQTCCDSLKAPLPAVAFAPVTNLLEIKPAWPDGVAQFALPEMTELPGHELLVFRPPRAESFSELVLCRSLRSHAPPLVVA